MNSAIACRSARACRRFARARGDTWPRASCQPFFIVVAYCWSASSKFPSLYATQARGGRVGFPGGIRVDEVVKLRGLPRCLAGVGADALADVLAEHPRFDGGDRGTGSRAWARSSSESSARVACFSDSALAARAVDVCGQQLRLSSTISAARQQRNTPRHGQLVKPRGSSRNAFAAAPGSSSNF